MPILKVALLQKKKKKVRSPGLPKKGTQKCTVLKHRVYGKGGGGRGEGGWGWGGIFKHQMPKVGNTSTKGNLGMHTVQMQRLF